MPFSYKPDSFVGQEIPEATLVEVPYSAALDDPKVCPGAPVKLNTREAFKSKKVVIVSVPGSFTPTCHGNHVPGYLQKAASFSEKGYEVYVISFNDAFVMSGWRSSLGGKGEVHFATEADLGLSKALNATFDASKNGLGIRGARYALVVDDLKIKSFAIENTPGELEISSADSVLRTL